jgi:tetratricopeptide (TPR) repeat protein
VVESGVGAAQRQHRAAVRAFARGDYRQAITRFSAADQRAPSPAFSFNIAKACEALGDASHALAFYRDYLRRANSAPDAARVRERIDVLSAQLASQGVQQVTLLSSPAGASAFVDREPVGIAPVTLDLVPGKHEVMVKLDGYETVTTVVELPANRPSDISFALVAAENPRSLPAAAPLWTAPSMSPREDSQVAAHTSSHLVEHRPGGALRTMGFVTLGASVAALGSALTFEIMRAKSEDNAKHETEQTRFAERLDTMQSQQTLARVFAGTGGALAALGGILIIAANAAPDRKPGEGMAIACQPSRCQATLSGAF